MKLLIPFQLAWAWFRYVLWAMFELFRGRWTSIVAVLLYLLGFAAGTTLSLWLHG